MKIKLCILECLIRIHSKIFLYLHGNFIIQYQLMVCLVDKISNQEFIYRFLKSKQYFNFYVANISLHYFFIYNDQRSAYIRHNEYFKYLFYITKNKLSRKTKSLNNKTNIFNKLSFALLFFREKALQVFSNGVAPLV